MFGQEKSKKPPWEVLMLASFQKPVRESESLGAKIYFICLGPATFWSILHVALRSILCGAAFTPFSKILSTHRSGFPCPVLLFPVAVKKYIIGVWWKTW